MTIFNSLGSNYDFNYVLKSFYGRAESDAQKKLINLLQQRYTGKAILFYKGREALTAGLKELNLPEDSRVAINGFTCVAVFNSIRKAGLEPLCLDLEKNSNLNFSPESLEKALKANNNIKAVVVQNTFGYPCDIEKIESLCHKHNFVLIEDLAHCVGTKYADGREAGTVGDIVILSFSQDKIIDAVSGGALIIRNKKYKIDDRMIDHTARLSGLWKDKLYPELTYKIRKFYGIGLGKPYHFVLRRLGCMTNLMNEAFYEMYSLPNWHCTMALYQFSKLDKQLIHRKQIAGIYTENLPREILSPSVAGQISLSSNLRFPIFTKNRDDLVTHLQHHKIFISDTWYVDVAPESTEAVDVSKIIVNLPTHINVKEKDARKICILINQWTK